MNKTSIINYQALGERIGAYAKSAGRVTTRSVLLLYYVLMKSEETLKLGKLIIFSAISYQVFPIDNLDVKLLPIIGWFDEVASISVTYQHLCKHLILEMEAKVDAILDRWFPEYIPYELLVE